MFCSPSPYSKKHGHRGKEDDDGHEDDNDDDSDGEKSL
jgi:hypothetical protein